MDEKHCKEGFDKNPDFARKTDEQKKEAWEFVVKMMCIMKDLYNGNPNLPKGCEEEAVGHNAIAGGFQGQRQWTDFYPNGDFAEALMNSSFDWEGARESYILATENDTLNGVAMLFNKLLTNRAQILLMSGRIGALKLLRRQQAMNSKARLKKARDSCISSIPVQLALMPVVKSRTAMAIRSSSRSGK